VYGTKDRSWGIRPVGDPAPVGAPVPPPGLHFVWAPLHWPDRCTHMCVFEDNDGVPWHFDGMICPVYANPDEIPGVEDPDVKLLASGSHRIDFVPGTRRAARAELELVERGGVRHEITLEPQLCFRMKGIGYTHLEWGHGRWKGELAIGGESWRTADLDEMAIDNLHVQQVMRARSADGRQGVGVMEQIHMGPSSRYGFKEFLDPAR